MGAGASTGGAQGGGGQAGKPARALSSRSKAGEALGPEFEVVLVRPEFGALKPRTPMVLRIAYEALVFLGTDRQPLTHFVYQDIICWGSNPMVFQFKVFGYVFGLPKAQFVPILLRTTAGKEIEQLTLSSVRSLMTDMEREAVGKEDFNLLKEILTPNQEEAEEATTPEGTWMAGRVEMIKQFGMQKRYTVNQGVELLTLLKLWSGANREDAFSQSFDLIELVVFLWGNILNPDSFQLLLNVFDDQVDRENIIMRLQTHKYDDATSALTKQRKQSLALLKADCPEGLGQPGQTAGQAAAYARQAAHPTAESAGATLKSSNSSSSNNSSAHVVSKTPSQLPPGAPLALSRDTPDAKQSEAAGGGGGGGVESDAAAAQRVADEADAAEAKAVAEAAEAAEAAERAMVEAAVAAADAEEAKAGTSNEPVERAEANAAAGGEAELSAKREASSAAALGMTTPPPSKARGLADPETPRKRDGAGAVDGAEAKS